MSATEHHPSSADRELSNGWVLTEAQTRRGRAAWLRILEKRHPGTRFVESDRSAPSQRPAVEPAEQ